MNKAKFNNGRRYPVVIKQKAVDLRNTGRTHREIAKALGISLGSANLWTRGIRITSEQKLAIERRRNKPIMTPSLLEKLRRNAQINLIPRLEKYTKETLLEKIVAFHRKHGRIPLKREFNMFNEYKRRFGSWNAAVAAAGFLTNPIIFAYKFHANDGHRCDSFTERIIDNWLSDHGIAHQRNYKYADTKMTADFFVAPDVVVEFFGLAGVQKSYDAIIERKRGLCRILNLKLVEIYPADVFEKPRLAELLKF